MSKELIVVKSNKLIESYHNMPLDEMRILLLTIAKLDPLNPSNQFDFSVQDFISTFNADKKSAYRQVQKAIDSLGSRWVVIADNEKYKEKIPFFSKQIYYKESAVFTVKLHDDLMPFLCDLTREFTRYELKHIVKFKSFHSIRMYELLAQYKNLKTRIIDVEQLKKWFLLENAYDRFTNFETFVLKTSVADINKFSDLNVAYRKIKRGKKIESLEFFIDVKQQNKQIKSSAIELLPRPQVRAKSHEEGEWARKNINIIISYYRNANDVEHKLSLFALFKLIDTAHLKKLISLYKIIGDSFNIEDINKILSKR